MPVPASSSRPRLALQGSDLLGLSRLGFDATLGIMNVVEHVHHTIASGAGIIGPVQGDRARGLTGGIYGIVRGTTRIIGQGLNALVGAFVPPPLAEASTPPRETMLAVLNGVWGDHLAESGNPLAITSALRVGGLPLDLSQPLAGQLPDATGTVLVLAHGLCMNDLQWTRQGHDHGQALARDLGCTPVYLHYNSGRHVSDNGRELASLLDQLVAAWPVPVQRLLIVAHSMGGLVVRSACHVAGKSGQGWLRHLKKIVFLGTPHHGAPLERGGRLVDTLFGVSPYLAPFSRLSKARSAGITDLRYGNLQDADWHGRCRHTQRHDDRRPTPLPPGVRCYVVAATKGARSTGLHSRLIADGLVPVASALGEHRDPALALHLPRRHHKVVTGASHWDLLSRQDVYALLLSWLR